MGRLVKNPDMVKNTGPASSTLMPGGTSSERPDSPEPGQSRFSTTTNAIEYWNGTVWQQGAASGQVTIVKDSFVGNAALLVFTMSRTVDDAEDIIVTIGGTLQNPGVSYTVDGSTTITFTSAPPNLTSVLVLHGYNEVI